MNDLIFNVNYYWLINWKLYSLSGWFRKLFFTKLMTVFTRVLNNIFPYKCTNEIEWCYDQWAYVLTVESCFNVDVFCFARLRDVTSALAWGRPSVFLRNLVKVKRWHYSTILYVNNYVYHDQISIILMEHFLQASNAVLQR